MPAAHDPVADSRAVVTHGNATFTVLFDRMLRMEWAEDGVSEDRATLTVCNRRTPTPAFTTTLKGNTLSLKTNALTLTYTDDGAPFSKKNLTVTFRMGAKKVTWHPGMRDPLNLKATLQTLDGMVADKKEKWVRTEEADPNKPILKKKATGDWVWQGAWAKKSLGTGLLSRSGWAVVDESESVVLDPMVDASQPWVTARGEGVRQDLYLLAYGHAYTDALREAQDIFGRQPLPPRYALGYWYSKYWAYTDKELERLVAQFDTFGVPLDVLVIDMDWHKMGWTGYSWDRDYFPDPETFLGWLHARDVKITLNLHPADGVLSYEDAYPAMLREMGLKESDLPPLPPKYKPLFELYGLDPKRGRQIPFDLCNPDYMRAYFKCLHHPLERQGVDFWWMDWQQGNTGSTIPGLKTLPWINELHWQDQAANHPESRPLNFSRYGGLGAGRMPVGFSGDTHICWESLAFQPYMTATAGNVLYGYWSHDIGGHLGGDPEGYPELYARWLQFGIFSPVVRTHTSKSLKNERRAFEFPEPHKHCMIDAIRLRYAMIPYTYTECRRAYDSGVSLLRPMYYACPDVDAAYTAKDQYMFGDDLLVAPVIAPADPKHESATIRVWLPKGTWFDTARGQLLQGGKTLRRSYRVEEIPVFAKAGSILPMQGTVTRLRPGSYPELLFTCHPGGDGSYTLYEDDGISTAYQDGTCASIRVSQKASAAARTLTLDKVKGSFDGFLPTRPVSFLLPSTTPPASVRIGGKTLPYHPDPDAVGWSYDGDTATTRIHLGTVDLRKGARVSVTFGKKGAGVVVDGLPGLLRRLRRVMDLNNLVSPFRPIHAGERLAVKAGQTGNRITRNPQALAEELKQLRAICRELPKALQGFRNGYAKQGRRSGEDESEKIDALRHAERILAATKKEFPGWFKG